MIQKKWTKPKIDVVDIDELKKIMSKTLSIESSLFASGCHHGMFQNK
jgi:hypothetical protein